MKTFACPHGHPFEIDAVKCRECEALVAVVPLAVELQLRDELAEWHAFAREVIDHSGAWGSGTLSGKARLRTLANRARYLLAGGK